MRAGGCKSGDGWFLDAMQTDWSDDDAFPEMRRDSTTWRHVSARTIQEKAAMTTGQVNSSTPRKLWFIAPEGAARMCSCTSPPCRRRPQSSTKASSHFDIEPIRKTQGGQSQDRLKAPDINRTARSASSRRFRFGCAFHKRSSRKCDAGTLTCAGRLIGSFLGLSTRGEGSRADFRRRCKIPISLSLVGYDIHTSRRACCAPRS